MKINIRWAGLLLISLSFSLLAQRKLNQLKQQVPLANTQYQAIERHSAAFLRTQMSFSPSALTHGKRQVERMIEDRPTMRRYVTVNDPIYTYAVRMFAGAATGDRIAWHSEPPEIAAADSRLPSGGHLGYIRVNRTYLIGEHQGKERPGVELWECAIFEFNNMRQNRTIRKIDEEVLTGKLTNRQVYLKRVTQSEFKAMQESMEFYVTLWKPCMQAKGMATNPVGWWADMPSTYEEWIARYTDHNGYPWKDYNKDFDAMVSYRLKARNRQR